MTSACSHPHSHPPLAQAYVQQALLLLKAKGLRVTEPRKQILDLLAQQAGPTNAYQLRDRLVALHGKADIVTIYRVLECLEAHGLLHRLLTRPGAVVRCQLPAETECRHAEAVHHCHHVLVCRCCDGVEELHCPGMETVVEQAEHSTGYRVETHYLEFLGLCPNCKPLES
ncbi:MAG: Fur family transcriptional regulator [Vampirovibrionales bacterium]